MLLRKELQQRLVKEYKYATNKMQEETNPLKKLYYFSVFYAEAQRTVNWEWNSDLALIYMVTNHVYNQISAQFNDPKISAILPINWEIIFDKLTQTALELATYFGVMGEKDNREELYKILTEFAEVSYAASGNGSYLQEKGAFRL